MSEKAPSVKAASKACSQMGADISSERKRFVALTTGKYYQEDSDDEVKDMNMTINSKVMASTRAAADKKALKKQNMPKVCHGMQYSPPVVATHPRGPKHENIF